MVPALHRALEELKKNCDQKLREAKQKNRHNGNNGQTIKELKDTFQPFGFKEDSLSTTTQWNQSQGPRSKLNSAIKELNTIKDSIKNAFERDEGRDRYLKAAENSVPCSATTSCATTTSCAKDCNASDTPRTIREMLLWLMGLPYCEGYKEFTEKLEEKHSCPLLNEKQKGNDAAQYFIHRQLSAVIFQLPVLFFTLEADVSYLRDTFCQFTGNNKNCTTGTDTHCRTEANENCTTGTKTNCTVLRFSYERCGRCLLRTFCACVAVLYPVQRFLFKRCEAKSTASRAPRRHSKQTAQDKDCCAPCPLGFDDWSQLCVKGPSKDCNSGNCFKDNNGSAVCNTSTPTVTPTACQCRALYDFVCFMGFRVGATVGLRGMGLHGVLKDCFGDQDEEDIESVTRSGSGSKSRSSSSNNKTTYVKLASCWRLSRCVLRNHCQKGESSPVCHVACSSKCCVHCSRDTSLPYSSCSPSTVRQMMLWLIGLPLTEAYKKDQDTVSTGQASSEPSASGPTASPCYLFGSDGCVSKGVQCIPPLKKLEENNNTQVKAPKKGPAKNTISYDRSFKRYYKESIVWMLVVFNAIEGGLTSVLCYLRDHAPGTGASTGVSHCTQAQPVASSSRVCSRFTYEFNDPSELLGAFCTYVYKVHAQLRFLYTMCSVGKGLGGWRHCIYGGHNQIKNLEGDIRCQCSGIKYTGQCHHPLQNFLTDGDKKKSLENRFKHGSSLVTMGFHTERLPSQRTEGSHIATVLEALIDTIHTSSTTTFTRPLSLLAQYCVAIGQLEPRSLGDLFTVFGDVAGGMWTSLSLYGQEGQTFSRTLSSELWSVFKCCSDKCKQECDKKTHSCSDDCQDSNKNSRIDCAWRYRKELKESISSVMARHKECTAAQDSKAPNDPCNYSHHYSLSSLMCSETTNTGASSPEASSSVPQPCSPSPQCASPCGPYLKSLSQGLYTYYCPSVPGAGDSKSFGALQWLYDRLRQLLDGMKKLKEAFENCECCHINNLSRDSKDVSCQASSCSDIVSCPYAHPIIYKFGFMLGEPEALKGNDDKKDCKGQEKKNCLSFLQQLGCVLKVPEGCQKGCCEKEKCCNKMCEECSVICSQQCNSVPSQASPVCSSSPVSALYLAFECVISIVYRILLKKALLKVECKVKEWYNNKKCDEKQQEKDCSSQKDNENALQCQLIEAFSLYVTNAMYDSYPAVMCTFACQVFKENVNGVCDVSKVSHASRVPHCPRVHMAPGPRIITRTSHTRDCHCSKLKDGVPCCSTCNDSNASLCISKSSVTTITPIIPQYTAPVIDPYHYRVFQKKSDTESKEKASGTSSCATYDFQSAMDFHVEGANSILPVPANLRSAVDWILRVTTGAPATGALATQEKNNDCAVVCQERNDCRDGQKRNDCNDCQRGALLCDPEVAMFQCLAQEISCVLNGDQKDADKKQCDQKDSDAVSTRNASSTVSQCQECNALKACNTLSTVSNTCAQCLLRSLAQGLRTLVGYKDMTQEVKGEVCQRRNRVRGELCSLLQCLRAFMCNEGVMSPECSTTASSKCSLSAELGNALLKGRYEIKGEPLRDIFEAFLEHYDILTGYTENLKGAPFTDVLCIFSRALTSEHKQCHSDLRCNTLNKEKNCANVCKNTCATTPADTSKGFPQGLSQLCEFFQGIQRFACEWNHIGRKGSEAQECQKKGEQSASQDSSLQKPCQSCSKLYHFAPSSDVVFNERRKAECLGWQFEGQKKDECDKKECPQECPCKEPKEEPCASLSSSSSSSPSCPRGFFQQLQCGLHVLGLCAQKVSELMRNNSVTLPTTGAPEQCSAPTQEASPKFVITQYRKNICALIEALKKFGEHIQGCKFEGAPQGSENVCALNCNTVCQDCVSQSNDSVPQCSPSHSCCRADASYAVDGAKKLIEKTKRRVEKKITGEINKSIIVSFTLYTDTGMLSISNILSQLDKQITFELKRYQSHLDDLKRLCQWLYRMGQLYASGLKGFVESLVKHLQHIIQVIDWITGIERMMTRFGQECVSNARGLLTVGVLKCIPQCCERHKGSVPCKASVPTALCDRQATCTNGTAMDSSSSSTTTCVASPSVFFDALNCRIDNLLSSYVLGPLPRGAQKENDAVCSQGQDTQGVSPTASGANTTVDRSGLFRQFLERLRLLALDRYTLQIWEDESCPKDRVSSIRHWSIFKDGIVRHTDLKGIKRALGSLTLMEDYRDIRDLKGLCSSSDCASSSKDGQKDSSVHCSNISSTASSISTPHRIHDFHAICVLQKFSYEAPLRALQCSIKGLQKIMGCLQECNEGLQRMESLLKKCDCHSRGVTSCDDQCLKSCKKECLKALSKDCCKDILSVCSKDGSTATPFCKLYRCLCDFLNEKYGIYNLALFLHTILGPNAFSAAICSLRDLRDILCQLLKCCDTLFWEPKEVLQCSSAPVPSSKDSCCPCRLMRRMCAIVSALNGRNHLRTAKDTVKCTVSCAQCNVKEDCYSLAAVTKRLQAFISTLRREYIFSYPVVCGIESDRDCNAVCDKEHKEKHKKDSDRKCDKQSSVTPSHTSTTSTVSLTSSPMPLLCTHCHLSSSICPQCIPLLAKIFITLVPVLYPQLCYLAYQCRLYWQQDHMNGYKDSALRSLMRTFGFDSKDLIQDFYIGLRCSVHHVYWLLCKETNSLQILCQDFTEEYNVSPFNTNSPFHRLYTLCLMYYRCRRTLSLTESKSTTPVMPTTLREILRFFVYLPFSAQFHSLQDVLRSHCSQSCVVSFSDLFATLMMSSAMSAVLLQLIECPQGAFLRFFDDIYTNTEGLYFGTNTETLFYQLCDLSVTLYRSLKFLSLQCGTGASLAGWNDCRLRGVKKNTQSEDTKRQDITQALDTQQLQLCASHLCLCSTAGAKDSSTTTPMALATDSSVSTQPSHTTCSFPLLRYLTDADCFFDSRRTVPSALRKVCLNDSCQEMIYRHMAPRGWEKGAVQCAHRDEQHMDSQLRDEQSRDCDLKACSSVCHCRNSDLQRSDLSNCCSHPCCCAQCCAPVCSTLYGHDLFQLLRNFVGHEHDADPLLQFTRYMVAIAAWPPDSLSGYMTFMLRFSDCLRKEKNGVSGSVTQKNASQKNGVNSSVLSSLKSEISLFPGEFKPECLIDAFLRVTDCDRNNGVTSSSPATFVASSSSGTSLSSQCSTSSGVAISVLRDCKDCKCIIYPLDYEIYDLYLPMYARRYLTWMLHFGPRLHRGMRALERAFERHIRESNVAQSGVSPVCSTDTGLSDSHTSVPCHASMLQCPFALPELHAAGLHFWDPKRMCNVSCECLLQRLQCALKDSSPLAEFLRQCDSFLWSVRKPFYWLTMALWIVATVYLLFVHFWRLDSWRLLSHGIRSRASHLVYPKVILSAELDHSYERYYAPR